MASPASEKPQSSAASIGDGEGSKEGGRDGVAADAGSSTSSHATHGRPSSPTSASSRMWSSWISPSTSASTAASSRFEERRKPKRPTFEQFRAQEPPQARLIRLRGLFDVLLDKDDEQALAGGRAKEEWTRSAMRARYGAGGMYARGSLAPKREESATGNGDVTFGFSTESVTASPSSPSSSRSSNSPTYPSPPRQSYAKELLSQCRACRAELEKERQAYEKAKGKARNERDDKDAETSTWTSWIPFVGDGSSEADEPSFTDRLAGYVGLGSDSSSRSRSDSSSSSIASSITSLFSVSDSSTDKSTASSSSSAKSELPHSDHEGEAGWIGSGVWGLSAVGARQRQADRERDHLVAKGHEVEDDGGRRQRQIEWEGFLRYADIKERELYSIFTELDKNGDMRLDVPEIAAALKRANIELSSGALEDFVTSLGATSRSQSSTCPTSITFAQFRDYFLLLPRQPSVNEIYRFYQVRKAFGLFGSQGIFAEFSERWGRSERHGATAVTQDGDVSLAGEERKKVGEDEREARREARRIAAAAEGAENATTARDNNKSGTEQEKGKQQLASQDNAQQDPSQIHEEEEDEEEDSDMIHGDVAVKFLLAGGIAGAVSRTATAPFDRLKIYLITTSATTATGSAMKMGTVDPTKIASRGVGLLSEAVTTLYRQGGGLRAFWVGNGLNCLKIFPESAIKFLSYETSKRAFAKYVDGVQDSRDISGSSRFMSGGIGGITSQFAIYPVETLKTRLMASQNSTSHHPGNKLLGKTAREMWKNGGMRTYYRGLTAGLIGVFPYSAIDMSTFEGIKLFYIKYTGREEPGVLALLAFGSISGSVGATTVYPLSLIRTRLQAAGTPSHPQLYDGFWDCCRKTLKNEGAVGFYRGLVPSLAKVVPAVSISYVVYEHSKRHLGVQ